MGGGPRGVRLRRCGLGCGRGRALLRRWLGRIDRRHAFAIDAIGQSRPRLAKRFEKADHLTRRLRFVLQIDLHQTKQHEAIETPQIFGDFAAVFVIKAAAEAADDPRSLLIRRPAAVDIALFDRANGAMQRFDRTIVKDGDGAHRMGVADFLGAIGVGGEISVHSARPPTRSIASYVG